MKLYEFEKMVPHVEYAFTFCVSQDGGGSIASRVCHNLAFLRKYMNHCNYILYPEISKRGRLHYHGYIYFKSYRQILLFNMEVMPYLFEGNADIEIDTIRTEFGDVYWYCYIRKMRHLMKPYFNEHRIMYKIDSRTLPSSGFKTAKEQFKNTLSW